MRRRWWSSGRPANGPYRRCSGQSRRRGGKQRAPGRRRSEVAGLRQTARSTTTAAPISALNIRSTGFSTAAAPPAWWRRALCPIIPYPSTTNEARKAGLDVLAGDQAACTRGRCGCSLCRYWPRRTCWLGEREQAELAAAPEDVLGVPGPTRACTGSPLRGHTGRRPGAPPRSASPLTRPAGATPGCRRCAPSAAPVRPVEPGVGGWPVAR